MRIDSSVTEVIQTMALLGAAAKREKIAAALATSSHHSPSSRHQATPTVIQMKRLAIDARKPTRHQAACVT
jgi:hypothetical protein